MITKNIYNLLIILLLALSLAGCSSVKLPPYQQEMIKNNEKFYTKINMWTERGHILATNYKRGSFIPVNSPVIIDDIDSSEITFNYNGTDIDLINIENYTKVRVEELFERTFSSEKIDLSQFNEKEKMPS